MSKNRLKTKSKIFYDDEVLFVDEEGTHLKIGVTRMNYGTELDYNNWRGQVSFIEMDLIGNIDSDLDNEY